MSQVEEPKIDEVGRLHQRLDGVEEQLQRFADLMDGNFLKLRDWMQGKPSPEEAEQNAQWRVWYNDLLEQLGRMQKEGADTEALLTFIEKATTDDKLPGSMDDLHKLLSFRAGMDEVRLRTVENFNSDNSRELFRKRVQFWLLYASVGLASLIGLGVAKHYSGNQPIHPPAVEAGDH